MIFSKAALTERLVMAVDGGRSLGRNYTGFYNWSQGQDSSSLYHLPVPHPETFQTACLSWRQCCFWVLWKLLLSSSHPFLHGLYLPPFLRLGTDCLSLRFLQQLPRSTEESWTAPGGSLTCDHLLPMLPLQNPTVLLGSRSKALTSLSPTGKTDECEAWLTSKINVFTRLNVYTFLLHSVFGQTENSNKKRKPGTRRVAGRLQAGAVLED